MNKIFKIVFNAARGKMMVVNEATSSVQTGKKAAVTVAVIGALLSGNAVADSYFFGSPDSTKESKGLSYHVYVGDIDSNEMFSFDKTKAELKFIDKKISIGDAYLDGAGALHAGIQTSKTQYSPTNEYHKQPSILMDGGEGTSLSINVGDGYGIVSRFATVEIGSKAKELDSIVIKSTNPDYGAIYVTGRDEGTSNYQFEKQTLNLYAKNITIDGKIIGNEGNAVIVASQKLEVNGDISSNITQYKNWANLDLDLVGGAGSSINGNIEATKDAEINITLGQGSAITGGNIHASCNEAGKEGVINLNLGEGSSIANDVKAERGGEITIAFDKAGSISGAITVDDESTLNLSGDAALNGNAKIEGTLGGDGALLLNDAKKKIVVVEGAKVKATLGATGAVNDTLGGDASKLNIEGYDGEVVMQEGEVIGEVTAELAGGKVVEGSVTQAVNSKTEALADKVSLAPHMITRIMMNDVRKRMGDLRAAEGTHGVWARYNGGQMSATGVDADFHMVQVGIDTVPVVDAPRFGVAFSYAETEAKDNLGTTDMDSFSLAFYGTKMYDNGMFVDVIGRMATMDSDIVNAGAKGKMDNVALSLSGELGWRFDVTDRFFFEPSVEATYTYTNADTFTMTNGGTYELEAVDSLVGRAGFAAGFKCPANKGDVYVRAAVVHEFMGDMTVNSSLNGVAAASLEADGKDTWVEFGIGANFNVNKNTYVYADIERTEGAAMDEDWRANVGVRFAF